jgi:hypothetical protein
LVDRLNGVSKVDEDVTQPEIGEKEKEVEEEKEKDNENSEDL